MEMCEMVGVGVRVLARCEEGGTCVEGGGVIWYVALSTRCAWSFEIAAAVLSGSVA